MGKGARVDNVRLNGERPFAVLPIGTSFLSVVRPSALHLLLSRSQVALRGPRPWVGIDLAALPFQQEDSTPARADTRRRAANATQRRGFELAPGPSGGRAQSLGFGVRIPQAIFAAPVDLCIVKQSRGRVLAVRARASGHAASACQGRGPPRTDRPVDSAALS
jgi:hypothetical protein